jgi:hypothetical protein
MGEIQYNFVAPWARESKGVPPKTRAKATINPLTVILNKI